MSQNIPDLPSAPQGRKAVFSASVVWLVPLAALAVAAWVGVSSYAGRGPLIQITLEDAGGILPNETELRYRNVSVGLVEKVQFNADLSRVVVDVRVDKSVAPFVDDEAEFWVVQPEVTTSGVSGLQTVLSGVYIAGSWDSTPGGAASSFAGLDKPPLVTADRPGTVIGLRSSRASGLAANRPILFKGIEVGRVGSTRIDPNGDAVIADAIIYEDHVRLVSTATRFWDTSGFSFSLGPNGAELDFSSVASLVTGGITFDTLVSGGTALRPGAVFEVFPDQATARNSIFEANDGATVTLTMIFEENVSGLAEGSVVEWRGVRIGQVVTVTGIVDPLRFGDARVRLLATVDIRPQRFGLGRDLSEEDALTYLEDRVAEGLRARLATASILTGGLKIELVTADERQLARLDRAGDPFPIFPVTESEISDVTATAEGVFQRINSLPIDELLQSSIAFLDNATALVASDALRDAPDAFLGLMADARGVIGSDEVQALPADLRALLADLQLASGDLRAILQELRDAGAVDRLLAAVDQAGAAAETANAAMAGLPDLTARVTAFVDGAAALPLDQISAEALALAGDLRALVASDALRALPEGVASAVAELDSLLSGFTEARTPQVLAQTLTEAGATAQALQEAIAGVPQIVARIDRIAANVEEVALDDLVEELEGVIAAANRLFGDASDADLPEALASALGEAEAALAELRQGGLIESANATMGSAQSAAAAIESAVGQLPDLIARLNRAVGTAQTTIGDYGSDAAIGRQTAAALREIERAAKSISDLARAIERRPNSLILGR